MKTMNPIVSFACLFLFFFALGTVGQARTWTDAATKRTLEGEFVKVDGAKVVIRLTGGKTVSVAIDRLVEADRKFIETRMAKPARPQDAPPASPAADAAAGPLARLVSPVAVKPRPIEGEGEAREAGLEVTNHGEQAISAMVVQMFFLKEDGSVGKSVPHSHSGFSGERDQVLAKGKKFLIEVTSFFMEDDTAAVDGMVSEVTWVDGTEWPAWTGPTPEKEGECPVSVRMMGILGEGDRAEPVVACFNHDENKGVKGVQYNISYLDGEGKELHKTGYGSFSDDLMGPGKATAISGGDGPPEGAVDVKLSVFNVVFEDDSKWKPTSALSDLKRVE